MKNQQLPLVIATRNSDLALWQARMVQQLIAEHPVFSQFQPILLPMVSTGDKKLETSLAKVGGKGLFTYELEQAMEQRQAQIAVHSLKDVPVTPDQKYTYSYLGRVYYEDVAVFPTGSKWTRLEDLPQDSVVGTASVRRRALLANKYPHLKVKLLRGNVNTRLAKLDDPAQGYDAIILARAGLERLGLLANYNYQILDQFDWVSAPGQGIVAIQWDKAQLPSILAPLLNDPVNYVLSYLERTVSAKLGGSCSLPLGVYAYFINSEGKAISSSQLSKAFQEQQAQILPQLLARVQPTTKQNNLDSEQLKLIVKTYLELISSDPTLKKALAAFDIQQVRINFYAGDLQAQEFTLNRAYTITFNHEHLVNYHSPQVTALLNHIIQDIVEEAKFAGFEKLLPIVERQLADKQ
ncbi:hydroxymethylbilane synthase [Psittacicella hinzii]|nr:hydroxymethylbilane synthase [Psittacicella hinzii]